MTDNAYLDSSDLPNDISDQIIKVMDSHNILVRKVVLLNNDVVMLADEMSHITGKTPEEKVEMYQAFEKMRLFLFWLHGKRVNLWGGAFFMAALVYTLNKLGVDTEALGPLLLQFIEALTGFLNLLTQAV
jgi:hypothetical protein